MSRGRGQDDKTATTRTTGSGTPGEIAATTTPPDFNKDHSFTLQGVFDLQSKVGVLGNKIDNLSETVKELRDEFKEAKRSIEKFEKYIFAASVLFAVLVFLGGWVVNKAWELMMMRLKADNHPVAAQVVPQPPAPQPLPQPAVQPGTPASKP